MANDWTAAENERLAGLYVEALGEEVRGRPVSKRALLERARGRFDRTDGSLSFKLRNLSHAAQQIGLPYLRAFKPAENSQRVLVEVLEAAAAVNPTFAALLDNVPGTSADAPVGEEEPTPFLRTVQPPRSLMPQPGHSGARARRIDYATREDRNRSLGLAGERAVVAHHRWVLASVGRPDLASLVRHVAAEDGDGLGYDVLSVDVDGSPLYVEVKTTRLGVDAPFFVSDAEVRASQRFGRAYRLVRVFDWGSPEGPGHYVLAGDLTELCDLRPTTYQALPHPCHEVPMAQVEYLPASPGDASSSTASRVEAS